MDRARWARALGLEVSSMTHEAPGGVRSGAALRDAQRDAGLKVFLMMCIYTYTEVYWSERQRALFVIRIPPQTDHYDRAVPQDTTFALNLRLH